MLGDPSAEIYDLGTLLPTWDFLTFLVNAELTRRFAKCESPLRIRLQTTHMDRPQNLMSMPVRRQMLQWVVRPLMPMLGAREDPSIRHGNGLKFGYWRCVEACRQGVEIPKINVVVPRVPGRLTITLREAAHGTWRNSRVLAWREFAHRRRREGYEVIVVRDTCNAEIPFEDFPIAPKASRIVQARAELYASADCNLLSSNGPANLLIFSPYPFIYFIPLYCRTEHWPTFPQWWQKSANINPGEDFPWMDSRQNFVWDLDTLENIEAAWAKWTARPERMVA
jgi:hypothetical protein